MAYSRISDSNEITERYMDSILIKERLIDSVVADTSVELFGEKFDSPVLMPAFSHLHVFAPEREDGMCEYARAAKALGAVNFVGMGPDEEFSRIAAVGAPTVRIVKPYLDRDKVRAQLAHAVSCGALAVGMDIDHSFSSSGGHDSVFGEVMAPVSKAELAELVSSVSVPFVVKGVLSVRDALACAEAGAQAILVSHHHGRMPFAVPPPLRKSSTIRARWFSFTARRLRLIVSILPLPET